jgi:hypothetical protein
LPVNETFGYCLTLDGMVAPFAETEFMTKRVAGLSDHYGVAVSWRRAPDVPCQQVQRGGTVKTAILNSVGIVLVVIACLMVCVALNAVS